MSTHFSSPRRRFLTGSAALSSAFATVGAGALGNLMLAAQSAHASDYKALVCVFLYGGNDGLNTIVPTDDARYAQYAAVRGALALPRSSLSALTGSDYGLHPALSALNAAWNTGQLAPVFNVGPLHEPLTQTQYLGASKNSVAVPEKLFSHSDQQVLWETATSAPNDAQARTGWGGRACDVLGTANPVIALGSSGRFGMAAAQSALVLPGPGGVFGAQGLQAQDMANAASAARKSAVDALYAEAQDVSAADVFNQMQRDAFAVSERLAALVQTRPGDATSISAMAAIDTAFAPITAHGKLTSELGAQLYQVAKLIQANATVRGNRQIFCVQMDGFDTHANQVSTGPTAGRHAALLQELGTALAAFQAAMNGLGVSDAVTTFTQSDFGRTFLPNQSAGTDHGWGNQHLVMGGAVKGKTTYGRYPQLVLGGPDDVGTQTWERQGRWIPTTSVDQYAATLLRWFGASEGQLDATLPNLANFGSMRGLGFL
jgi:uncharacterized protein (DUF1501 family)